jgi:gas vesicle protein
VTGEEGYTVTGQNRYTVDDWSRRHAGKVSFVLGLFVGAGAAILFASVSGREAREKVVEASKAMTNQAESCCLTAREVLTETIEKGKGWFRGTGPSLAAAIDAGKKAYAAEKRKVAKELTEASD